MKKKAILFILLGSVLSAGAVNMTGDRYRHHHHNKHYYYDRDKDRRVEEIEHRLDILQDEYKRDESRLEYSGMDKYERKIRKKELKYEYKREKERLKAKKKAIKNGYY